MKKTTTFLGLLAITSISFAQSPRMSLYEEFTGENCPPCASTNPVLDVKLAANANNTIPLKWQVAIPSAPSSLTSLYQQNKLEIDARDAYYNISSAPLGRMDGQSQAVFGATGSSADHPANITATILNNSAAVTSPFTVTMARAWDANFTTVTCTINITATGNYTTTGTNLKFRLVMTEKLINYAIAPGTNGEKEFHYVARKSYPDLVNGTPMANTWTVSQTQSFTVACVLPNYIWDKNQVEMVGFIQDDGNKKVMQSVLGTVQAITNDAAANTVTGLNAISCVNTYTPLVSIKNNGSNALTNLTINPFVNGAVNGASVVWTGNLAAGASTTVLMNPITSLPAGSNTYSFNITNVNGGLDNNVNNNSKIKGFSIIGTYAATPLNQDFTAATFPPANWFLVNPDGNTATWTRVTNAGGFGNSTSCTRYNSYIAPVGDVDDLFLYPMSLVGLTAPRLNFDVAHGQYDSDSDDGLDVLISTNCGTSWASIYSKSGASLATTTAFSTNQFVPTAAQWRSEAIELTTYIGAAQVLVKFVGLSDYGNSIYVDNINISGMVGINNVDKNLTSIEMYPNPTVNETSIKINATEQSDVFISVLNTVGQVVYQTNSSLTVGFNVVNIDTKNLASGIYNVVIGTKNGVTTKKLSVTK